MPQGHAPWLSKLLLHTPDDPAEGHRPLPWLTPSLTQAEGTLSWTSSYNVRSIRHNKPLSFCPGAIIDGIPQPYVVGAREVTSPLCYSLTLSIACPKVFHNALHTGSNSTRDFGLHTFPKFVFQQLKTAQEASWKNSFRPPSPAQIGFAPYIGTSPEEPDDPVRSAPCLNIWHYKICQDHGPNGKNQISSP